MNEKEYNEWKLANPIDFGKIEEAVHKNVTSAKIAKETGLSILLVNYIKGYILNPIKA